MTQFSKASMSRKQKSSLPCHLANTAGASHSNERNQLPRIVFLTILIFLSVGVFSGRNSGETKNNNGNDRQLVNTVDFPADIKDNELEIIPHPATLFMEEDGGNTKEKKDKDDLMDVKVPKFWNPDGTGDIRQYLGNNGERLMTPEEAAKVGSFVEVEGEGKMETIFIAIASYRDYRCPLTVETIFKRARYPERIRVAIVDQIVPGEDDPCNQPPTPDESAEPSSCEDNPQRLICKYARNISYFVLDASLSVGPVFARHIGYRMYRGEYFAMQTDAHMEFVDGWDVDIIHQWKAAKNEMAVLSTYVSAVNEDHIDLETGASLVASRPYMCDSIYEEDYYENEMGHMRHDQQPEEEPAIHGAPMLHPFWAAGFSFARGHFIVNVPYDQYLPMIFQGEEPNIGIRAFTYGYDIYAPERSVVFHYYGHHEKHNKNASKKKKKEIKYFWENENRFTNVAKYAMRRLKGIIQTNPEITNDQWNHIEESKYGIGKVRTTAKYFETFGIHPHNHTVEKGLCNFVRTDMHVKFSMALRDNRMGVDYDQITFQFKEELYPEKIEFVTSRSDDAEETDDNAPDDLGDVAETDDALSK